MMQIVDSNKLYGWRKIDNQEQRLKAYEKMHQNVIDRLQTTISKMEELKDKGKVKSVTYSQLMADKLTLQKIISMYEIYGID